MHIFTFFYTVDYYCIVHSYQISWFLLEHQVCTYNRSQVAHEPPVCSKVLNPWHCQYGSVHIQKSTRIGYCLHLHKNNNT